jgi:GNAT superfamily N-acetyltransferase
VTLEDTLSRAVANIEATYLSVGECGLDAVAERWEGGCSCRSPHGHAASNFAFVRTLDEARARSLAESASCRSTFNVYAAPGSGQAESARLLREAGFRPAGELRMQVGHLSDGPLPALRPADTWEEKMEIARFMTRQFFTRHTGAMREAVATATASAEVSLYRSGQDKIRCAAMVSRKAGLYGIYNLCVEHELRGRGLGGAFLAELMALAASVGEPPTLQCDPALEGWYAARGFRNVGFLEVFALGNDPYQAIM